AVNRKNRRLIELRERPFKRRPLVGRGKHLALESVAQAPAQLAGRLLAEGDEQDLIERHLRFALRFGQKTDHQTFERVGLTGAGGRLQHGVPVERQFIYAVAFWHASYLPSPESSPNRVRAARSAAVPWRTRPPERSVRPM